MFGVSFGEYAVYWIGLGVIGVGVLVATVVQLARGRFGGDQGPDQ